MILKIIGNRQVAPEFVIEAQSLSRQFAARGRGGKAVDAVRGISFRARRGDIVGFLGPNGPGKSTTLKMLSTLLRPTSGKAQVVGCDLLSDPKGVRRRIGYVAQSGATAREATVGLEITSQGRLYGLTTSEARRRGEELLAALDLPEVWTRISGSLSGATAAAGHRPWADPPAGTDFSGRTLDRPGSAKPREFVQPYPGLARQEQRQHFSDNALSGRG